MALIVLRWASTLLSDGTLLDTESLSTDAMNKFLVPHHHPVGVDWELKKKLLGKRADEWTVIVRDELGVDFNPPDLANAW